MTIKYQHTHRTANYSYAIYSHVYSFIHLLHKCNEKHCSSQSRSPKGIWQFWNWNILGCLILLIDKVLQRRIHFEHGELLHQDTPYLITVINFLLNLFSIGFGYLFKDFYAPLRLAPLSQPSHWLMHKATKSHDEKIFFMTTVLTYLTDTHNGVINTIAAWAKRTIWKTFQSCSSLKIIKW